MQPDKLVKKDISWEEAVEEVRSKLGKNLPKMTEMVKYRQKEEWFLHGVGKKHGVMHQTRVLVLAEKLSRFLIVTGKVGIGLNREALGWAAVTHDTQVNGGDYETHGERAANWIEKNWERKMSEETKDAVKYICEFHVPGDSEEMLDILRVFKDADALDRVRLEGGSSLDTSFLRFSASKEFFVPVARQLFELTNREVFVDGRVGVDEKFDGVLEAAVEMGLIRE